MASAARTAATRDHGESDTAEVPPPPEFLRCHPYYAAVLAAPPSAMRVRSTLLDALHSRRAAQALLLTPPATLASDHNLSEVEATALLAWAATAVSPLLSDPSLRLSTRCATERLALPLPTGLATLDGHLLGGLRPGFVVELTGPAGGGKTRLALQWSAAAILAGRAAADGTDHGSTQALWLHTSPAPSFEAQALSLLQRQPTGADTVQCLRQNLLSMPVVSDLEEFRQLPLKHVAHFLSQGTHAVRLLVLDSLTQLTHRGHSGNIDADNIQRQNGLVALVQELKQLAARHHLCVVLLTTSTTTTTANGSRGSEEMVGAQSPASATTTTTTTNASAAASGAADGSNEAPGEFGRMLYHSVNIRLRLDEGLVRVADPAGAATTTWGRVLRVAKSPISGQAHVVLLEAPDGSLVEAVPAREGWQQVVASPLFLNGAMMAALDAQDFQGHPVFIYT